ncbi:MAG: phosphoribosylaminoimidazolesuccinocarboxamide synthase [Algisphaera sp.]
MSNVLLECDLPLPAHRKGKVRDVYDVMMTDGTPATLLVASDRLSAFDVVMPTGIPGKGAVLTQLSKFWFDLILQKLGDAVPHHLLSVEADDIVGLTESQRAPLRGRVMLGRRADVVPIECVARGYLAGSGWKEYQATQTVCGVALPAGLKQCDRLPEPIFTPATKAATGHDENVSFEVAAGLVGVELMTRLRDTTLKLYELGRDHAATCGIVLADTKFEFGFPLDAQGHSGDAPILIDEVMTPDSSRFWPAESYEPGRDQDSFDKQFVRNHLQKLVDQRLWDKEPPGPTLPDDVVAGTQEKYEKAYEALTGTPFNAHDI